MFIQFNQFQDNTSSTAGLGVDTSCTVSNQIGVLAMNPLGNQGACLKSVYSTNVGVHHTFCRIAEYSCLVSLERYVVAVGGNAFLASLILLCSVCAILVTIGHQAFSTLDTKTMFLMKNPDCTAVRVPALSHCNAPAVIFAVVAAKVSS